MRLKCLRKAEEVQSRRFGDTILSSEVGIGVGLQAASGWSRKNCAALFLESMSAAVLSAPGMCEALIVIS